MSKTASATLIAHCGGEFISRAELAKIKPTQQATATWKPVRHGHLVDAVDNALRNRGMIPTREEYAIARDGAMMFGVMTLQYSNLPDVTAALGIRASNDKKMAVQIIVGMRIFVCDNMAFSSDGIALRKKHTSGLNLDREMVTAVDTFAGRYLTMEQQVTQMKERILADNEAKAIMFDCFRQRLLPQRLLPVVAQHYFEPPHEEFQPRTPWSLHNAFSEAFKEMDPMPASRANMRVSRVLGLTSTEGVN